VQSPIKRLLIVAGPTACGKSTFLRRLREQTLPAEILSRLPPGCDAWPQVNARKFHEGLLLHECIVLHYAINSNKLTFDYDPAFGNLPPSVKATILTLKVSGSQLFHQHNTRSVKTLALLLANPLKKINRDNYKRIYFHFKKLLKYTDEAWLESQYDCWDRFLKQLDLQVTHLNLEQEKHAVSDSREWTLVV
jgi:hypothetical protein